MLDKDSLIGKYCFIIYINIASDSKFEFEVSYSDFDEFLHLANSGLCDIELLGDNVVYLIIYN